ncbi:hypothetical protein [Saccharopolyspora phatthalungensis]|uniref:Uncharacterized protein n=1 Tax=Saccharopolyspora phatthalungensis TaxID=664693 RepID=A0A840QB17_9PSEU|nr:hypothetical protein [Saccharopolyspora phatthalungensis]MBB5157954.1 hypothetical protein [Saccharopolyspora phatthalungensis]
MPEETSDLPEPGTVTDAAALLSLELAGEADPECCADLVERVSAG